MGYWSTLYLVDVKIKETLVPEFKRLMAKKDRRRSDDLSFFLSSVMLDSEGFLEFKASKDGHDEYLPDEDGCVPALNAKWYDDEPIAHCLKRYSEAGGRMVFHSNEADGDAWGWQFDGRGKTRGFALCPVGRWR